MDMARSTSRKALREGSLGAVSIPRLAHSPAAALALSWPLSRHHSPGVPQAPFCLYATFYLGNSEHASQPHQYHFQENSMKRRGKRYKNGSELDYGWIW